MVPPHLHHFHWRLPRANLGNLYIQRAVLLRLTFSFLFLMTQQTHVTVYNYFLTRSCDSLVQIHPEDSVSIFKLLTDDHSARLLILNQLAY
jgi:hypothetical protein